MLILDDFLPDGELKEKMCREEWWSESVPMNWHNVGEPLKDEFHEFCNMIWTKVFNPVEPVEYIGWEYWSHSMDSNGTYKELGFHVDSDIIHKVSTEKEQEMIKAGEAKGAKNGFIYYCHKELPEGGYLEIQKEHGELERIQPVPNRLILFDPSNIHRVLRVTKGVRRSLVSNIWNVKPRWVIEEEMYAARI